MAAEGPEAQRWRRAAVFAVGVADSSRPMPEDEGAPSPRRGGP